MLTALVMFFLAGDIARQTAPPASEASAPAQAAGVSDSTDHEVKPDRLRRTYPWKKEITTTEFWIGEKSNSASAWDEHWESSNNGPDSPTSRQGYVSADHAPTLNPFYVALPFNDLAHPDLAKRWLPQGWERRPQDGKPVSCCKDRWLEIKNEQGDICYAQWEDAGPMGSDDAEYVFGDKPPKAGPDHGLEVSPAVAKYLGLDPVGKNRTVSWRFVDAEDVPPGYWLKFDEEADINRAQHERSKTSGKPAGPADKNTPISPKNSPPAGTPTAPAEDKP